MYTLKPFQVLALSNLKNEFLRLWNFPDINIPLVFKSPTGSGKTIMLAQFLREIVSDPRFQGNDLAFIWLTFSEDSYCQSKKKLFNYYGGANEINLIDLNDLARGRLNKNDVFFINWQKIKDKNKDSRKLRSVNERGLTFDSFIESTHQVGRKIILIIDEEHIGSDTNLAVDLLNLIGAKIILRVSATPKNIPTRAEIAGYVEVNRSEVIESGLIKEKIIFQTDEDLLQKSGKQLDQDEILLELAFEKRNELAQLFKSIGVSVNPLVLIQLPNDDQVSKGTNSNTKQSIVLDYLKNRGIANHQIAIWMSRDKENLDDLEKNNSEVSFLLFKQAAATGWDCPRACVLVMFREIKSPIFSIQTVGRILRMPFGTHFPNHKLNIGYLYTNYKRSEVLSEYSKTKTEYLPALNQSLRKKNVRPIELESVSMSRTDYNDLGDTFQETFKSIADTHLEISKLDLNTAVKYSMIVNAEISDYDNFSNEFRVEEDKSVDEKLSHYDVERLYNLRCFKIIADQVDENKKYAPERSWGKLKTAINIYLIQKLKITRSEIYAIIVNDLYSSNSVLSPVIAQALLVYRPIREIEVNYKAARAKSIKKIEIPSQELFFSDSYEKIDVKKSAIEPFWIEKGYIGRKNEEDFIGFLESTKNTTIEWWYKNGDTGSEYFSISYFSPVENKEKLFYPDWIVKTKNCVMIIDTKAGITAESTDTKCKAEALKKWLTGKKGFDGGIVVKDGPNEWKINRNITYSYDTSFKGWDTLEI